MASRRIYELTSIYSTGFTIDSSTEIAIDRGDYTEAYKMNLNELISYSSGGTSGTSGTSGSSGVDGVSGTDGTSGSSGVDGASGTDGTSGSSGVDGASGTDGTSGSSGVDGVSGTDGTSGSSGVDGVSGTDGTSGIDGTSGTSGIDGTDGTSGTSGIDGESFTGATTAPSFYYDTGTETLYTPELAISGLTTISTETPSYNVKAMADGRLVGTGYSTFTNLDIRVGEDYGFPTLRAAIDWLSISGNMSGGTRLLLTADEEVIEDTLVIDLDFPLAIQGLAYGLNYINPSPTLVGPVFEIHTDCSFDQVVMDATGVAGYGASEGAGALGHPGDDAIWVPSGNAPYVEFKDSAIYGFASGIHTHGSGSEFWVFEAVVNENLYGVWVSGDTVRYRSMASDYSENETYGLAFEAGTDLYFSSQSDSYENSNSAQTSIHVDRALSAITFDNFTIQTGLHNKIGNFSDGIDFSRSDGRDADMLFHGTQNVEESKPHFKFGMSSNTGTTTITTQNVWYKAVLANVPDSFYSNSWRLSGNSMTYLPQKTERDVVMWVSGSLFTTNNPATTYEIAIVKNGLTGTTYGKTSVTTNGSNIKTPFSVPVYLEDVLYPDQFTFYIRNTSGTADVVLSGLNVFGDSR